MGLRQDIVFGVAKRWIAGKTLDAGVDAARAANKKGFGALLNFLGEDVTDAAVAERETQEYFALQKAIGDAHLNCSVSVKLTQLGLLFDERATSERLQALAVNAKSLGQDLWLDMEGSKFTDATIASYARLRSSHENLGIALQAYLRRSEKDLDFLVSIGAKVRLVKGAYREDPSLTYRSRGDVRAAYSRLMRVLFERGDGFTIATHDSVLVDEAKALGGSNRTKFDFAMLRGIRDDLKSQLVTEGYRVVDYIPYGEDWYAYSIRRMKEHPSNVWLLLRSIL